MQFLIIEKDVRTHNIEYFSLFYATHKKGFIHVNAPVPHGIDHTLVGRRIARGHNGNPQDGQWPL